MSDTLLTPGLTTAGDLCEAALHESGAFGDGQTVSAAALRDAQARMQWMLQQWERKRWLVYHLLDVSVTSTGAISYSIGPGGDIDTNYLYPNPFNSQFNNQFGGGIAPSARPAKVESAFIRQLTQAQPSQIDYPLQLLQSREDYSRIALKQLTSFAQYLFYDPDWPLGRLYPWPVPQATIYSLHVQVRAQLPAGFASSALTVDLPFEYYNAIVLNLALRLRPKYGIAGFQGDPLPALAKDSLNVLRNGNVAIASLQMPTGLALGKGYDIFGDRFY